MDGSIIREVMDATRQTGDASYLLLRALAHQVAVMFATPSVLDRSLAEIIRWRQTPLCHPALTIITALGGRLQEVLCTRFRQFI